MKKRAETPSSQGLAEGASPCHVLRLICLMLRTPPQGPDMICRPVTPKLLLLCDILSQKSLRKSIIVILCP